jgi:hypothetical protein
MAKSGARIGLTLKIVKDDKNYDFWRPELECLDIDSDAPDDVVKKQIARAVQVSLWAYEAVTEGMNALVTKQNEQLAKELKK